MIYDYLPRSSTKRCIECNHPLENNHCLLHGTIYQTIAGMVSFYSPTSQPFKTLYALYKEEKLKSKTRAKPLTFKEWHAKLVEECIIHKTLIPK